MADSLSPARRALARFPSPSEAALEVLSGRAPLPLGLGEQVRRALAGARHPPTRAHRLSTRCAGIAAVLASCVSASCRCRLRPHALPSSPRFSSPSPQLALSLDQLATALGDERRNPLATARWNRTRPFRGRRSAIARCRPRARVGGRSPRYLSSATLELLDQGGSPHPRRPFGGLAVLLLLEGLALAAAWRRIRRGSSRRRGRHDPHDAVAARPGADPSPLDTAVFSRPGGRDFAGRTP